MGFDGLGGEQNGSAMGHLDVALGPPKVRPGPANVLQPCLPSLGLHCNLVAPGRRGGGGQSVEGGGGQRRGGGVRGHPRRRSGLSHRG